MKGYVPDRAPIRLGREMSGANRRRARWIGGAQPLVEA
jgi:hypothetical protein